MNLGEILDRTFHIYRSRFFLYVVIAALPALAIGAIRIVSYLLGTFGPGPNLSYEFRASAREFGAWLLYGNLESLLRCLLWPVFVYVASRDFMAEVPTSHSIIQFWKPRWKNYLLTSAAIWAVSFQLPHLINRFTPIGHAISSATLALTNSGNSLTERGVAGLVLVTEWTVDSVLVVLLSLGVAVWALEGLPVHRAMLRGWTLARGAWLRIFVAWFMTSALQWILHFAFSAAAVVIFRLVVEVSHQEHLYDQGYLAMFLFPVTAASIAIAPVFPIAITLFYYDQRIRREGYDIERLMESAGMTADLTPPAGEGFATPAVSEETPS
jgi:hypothetical protein